MKFFSTDFNTKRKVKLALVVSKTWNLYHNRVLPKDWQILSVVKTDYKLLELCKTNSNIFVYSEWDGLRYSGGALYRFSSSSGCTFITTKWKKIFDLEGTHPEYFKKIK